MFITSIFNGSIRIWDKNRLTIGAKICFKSQKVFCFVYKVDFIFMSGKVKVCFFFLKIFRKKNGLSNDSTRLVEHYWSETG